MYIMREEAPRVKRCSERNLIAVNNGIFDFDTKTLMPFTPDKVFTSKSRVDYNPNAKKDLIKLLGIDKNTYYKYKKELKSQMAG